MTSTSGCSICGDKNEPAYNKEYTQIIRDGQFLDFYQNHFRSCDACGCVFAGNEEGLGSRKSYSDSMHYAYAAKDKYKNTEIDEAIVAADNSPKHEIKVKVISKMLDGTVVDMKTPQFLITISTKGSPAKKVEFTLYSTSRIRLIEFLHSLTDVQCADFLKKK